MTRLSPRLRAARCQGADTHATALLAMLGIDRRIAAGADHPALAWRRAGLMAVTGLTDGPGLIAPAPLTLAADGALAALRAIAPDAQLPRSGASLLGERARLIGLTRRGGISPNGSCHLLATRDGTIALNLPRSDDWALLPALFESHVATLQDVTKITATVDSTVLVARGRLMGMAIAASASVPIGIAPMTIEQCAPPRSKSGRPLVVDFSALWAGPLAGSLLRDCGAHVVKVESRCRPDGARYGDPTTYDLLNAGKRSVALDFTNHDDLVALRALVRRADIIIEASRPRALRALGIDARAEASRGAVWVAITGHGRSEPAADWIGFGDDAAVAGGLSAAMHEAWGVQLFAGDAIADPLTGITAALASWASWLKGGGRIVSLALSQVVANAVTLSTTCRDLSLWQALAEADTAPLYPLRTSAMRASILGVDTAAVLAI